MQPLELGQPLQVQLSSGERAALTAGAPGEELAVRLYGGDRSRPATAVPMQVIRPGAHRQHPPCTVAESCGACPLQAVHYPAQLAAKQERLVALAGALGCPADRVGAIRGMRQPYGFRTTLTMPAGGRPGRLRFGLYRRGSMDLVEAGGCPVQHPLTLAALAQLAQVLDAYRIAPTTVKAPTDDGGWLHAIRIRLGEAQAAEVTLCGKTATLPARDLVDALLRLPCVHNVALSVVAARSGYPIEAPLRLLAGPPRLPVKVATKCFNFSPGSFMQTNAEGWERLAELVVEMVREHGAQRLADLYGGVGVFARLTEASWQKAVVVESNPDAIGDARAALSTTASLDLIEGRVEHSLAALRSYRPDLIIVDPPRRGCQQGTLDALGGPGASRLIYVACGVGSFYRDAGRLRELGWRLERVEAVDMFAHTTHLEIVACLVRA